jgi:hypothetical protein
MDKLLFRMPADPEAFIGALSVVQNYIGQVHRQAELQRRATEYELHLDIPNKDLLFLIQHVGNWEPWTGGWPPKRSLLDYVFEFDVESAYQLSLANEISMVQAFSIQAGAMAPDFPKLEFKGLRPEPVIDTSDVLVADMMGYYNDVSALFPDGKLGFVGGHFSEHELRPVLAHKMVLGNRSPWTYLAAILGKAVVEIYPADKHKGWLPKWENPNYVMLYGEPTAELVLRTVKRVWDHIPVSISATGV